MEKPKVIQSDNGREFMGKFDELLKKLNITHIRGRPYHPESQGSIECFNKYFKSQLDKNLLNIVITQTTTLNLELSKSLTFTTKIEFTIQQK